MKLYTKGGDDGSTGLFGGSRVPKDDARVSAYGEVDETNAAIGLALATCGDDEMVRTLRKIQSDLFVLGGELATPEEQTANIMIADDDVAQLERWIDEACAKAPPLRNFVLPGGTATAAALHLARTVCRRAERRTVALARQQTVRPAVIVYLNRLSDLLFALARRDNHRTGHDDILWTARRT